MFNSDAILKLEIQSNNTSIFRTPSAPVQSQYLLYERRPSNFVAWHSSNRNIDALLRRFYVDDRWHRNTFSAFQLNEEAQNI